MEQASRHGRRQQHQGGGLPSAAQRATATAPPAQQQQHRHKRPAQHAPPAQKQQQQQAQAQPPKLAHLTDTTFASLPLAAASQRALSEVLGFSHLTAVQEATLPVVLQGVDVMAKAKTGTGKTMAFLIPAVEALVRSPPPPKAGISVLILSPTRELASQIAKEAEALLTFHPFKAQVVYGGTNINSERNRLAGRCDVLVATPGRLQDHLQNSGLGQKLAGIRTLVLDEADQLLEMGFRPAIEKILAELPRQRQTLLFSATMPQAVKAVAGLALRPQYSFVDTVPPEEQATHVHVEQRYALIPLEDQFAAVHSALRTHLVANPHDYKVIAFFTTARLTQYMAALMNAAGLPVLEIHSRKSQSAREKASAAFRSSPSAILFSSDVSARGVDYPDISLVLQVGLPSSREQYIHRLGRTARAGKAGQGLLLLTPEEQHFMRSLQGLPLAPVSASELAVTAGDKAAVNTALGRVDDKVAEMAYVAWLGFYNSARGMGWSKPELVQRANGFSAVMGLAQPPALLKKTIGMMGLKGVPGLRIEEGGGAGNRGNGGGRGGGGGKMPRNGSFPQQQQAQQQQYQQQQQYRQRAPQQQQLVGHMQGMMTEQQLLQQLQGGGSVNGGAAGAGGAAGSGGKKRRRGGRNRPGSGNNRADAA